MEKKKPGRKMIPESQKRKHHIACRLTDGELEQLDQGRPDGMTRGEWLRTKALKRRLPREIPVVNREAWAELARTAANLNQLTRHLNQGNGQIAAALAEVDQLRNRLIGVVDESED